MRIWFPSPHSGILFLYWQWLIAIVINVIGFRPLIRGFFFYKEGQNDSISQDVVSVPSFGDSFFMSENGKTLHLQILYVSVPE